MIPPPGRVPGRSFDLSRSGGDDGGGSGPVEKKVFNPALFLGQGDLYGERPRSVAA